MKKPMNCHRGLRLSHILFYTGLGLMVFSLMLGGFAVILLSLVGIACVVAGIIVCVRYVKCPHCGKFLSRSGKIPKSIPKFCFECGKPL